MTGMDDGPQGRHVARIDLDETAAAIVDAHAGDDPAGCGECTEDGCPAWRWAQVQQATTIVDRHQDGGSCDRCQPDGCGALVDAEAVIVAARRDLLVASGRRDHPLLAW